MTGLIALSDGRKVQYEEFGDPAGVAALWFHGGFSSRLEALPLDAPARELGVRIIALDRPGVGGSDLLADRTVIGYASDVAQVLDALSLDQVAVGGLSNGGMYTMAVASQLPDRVLRAVPVNSTTPFTDKAALSALSRKARMSYVYMMRDPQKVADKVEAQRPMGPILRLVSKYGDPDRRLFEDPAIAAMRSAATAEAARQKGNGYLVTELKHAAGPWGFDHRAVQVPVTIVSGDKDSGLGYAKVWARELPDARLVVLPGGHAGMLAPAFARRVVEALHG